MNVRRVALVSPYALSAFGGVQEQVLAMSRVLAARDLEVLIVAPDGQDRRAYDTPARVVRLGRRWSLPANGSRAPLTLSPRAAWRARDALDAFTPDVVHFHEPFAPLLGWSALVAHDRPALGTFHRSGAGPALRYTRPLLRRLASGVDYAVSVSEAAARTLADACGLASDVLFNGFETERFVASPRERADHVVLFYVGRLERRKGVDVAITAVREHNASSSDPWQLVVAGEGPERARLEALAARDEAVVFVGAVSDDEKRRWLRRAHALVAPSTRGESFGLVLLEAMASETLVVASDIEGYRQAANGHGALFTAGDPAALAAAATDALARESAEGLAAARRHAERWSMTTLVEEYLERYDRAVRRFQATK